MCGLELRRRGREGVGWRAAHTQHRLAPEINLRSVVPRSGVRNVKRYNISVFTWGGYREAPRRGTRRNVVMILPQVHLRKPCYDFYFL